jgi:acyl-CoA synthetase (AMP-forming)/AMP-acid ligase II
MSWRSLLEMMADHAQAHPDALFTRFLDSNADAIPYPYGKTWLWILRWAELLSAEGVRPESKVVLALPNSEDFIGAYFGALLLEAVPAGLPPLRRVTTEDPYLRTLARRIGFIGACALVVPDAQYEAVRSSPLGENPNLHILAGRNLPASGSDRLPVSAPGDFALFQFTSGTSGNSKVVQLTHGALLAQTQMISTALQLDPSRDSAVSWLPLYHDMGLIGFLLTPARIAGTVNLLQTDDFILRPGLWIKALAQYQADITGGPPSGYLLAARRMKDAEIQTYRLDHVRIALMGAEMVTEDSIVRFLDKFAPIGFRRSSIMPTYGMAENGLAVTMPPLDRGPDFDTVDLHRLQEDRVAVPAQDGKPARVFASVGSPLAGINVAIDGGGAEDAAERRVGEILVRSPSLMDGYLKQPNLTLETLNDGWLHTGDYGYLAGGNLFITGRKKEILIVGGRNYYPEDLEDIAKDIPGVRMARVVAASYHSPEQGTEVVVLFAETGLTDPVDRDGLRQAIRKALVAAGYPVGEVVLLHPKTIHSTPNGKLMRSDCLDRYLSGEFPSDYAN